jgi:hypothetical protein
MSGNIVFTDNVQAQFGTEWFKISS